MPYIHLGYTIWKSQFHCTHSTHTLYASHLGNIIYKHITRTQQTHYIYTINTTLRTVSPNNDTSTQTHIHIHHTCTTHITPTPHTPHIPFKCITPTNTPQIHGICSPHTTRSSQINHTSSTYSPSTQYIYTCNTHPHIQHIFTKHTIYIYM